MARMLGLGSAKGTKWILGDDLGRRRKMLIRHERAREARHFARSLLPEGLLPTLLDDPSDCRHGCNGECETALYGSYGEKDGCNFTCH